jgi:hypothetical protein
VLCNYKEKGERNVSMEVCIWHKQKQDAFCKDCEKWGALIMFDLKKLGQYVMQSQIPDKPIFQLSQAEITELGKCFMEAKYDYDQAQDPEDKIPF